MRRLYVAMGVGIAALYALSVWKNTYSYPYKTKLWRAVKSLIDTALVVVSAVYMPALLVGWIVMWLTRPIGRRGIQATYAVLFGVIFASVGGVALEVLCVLGIFAVDLLTGSQGIYGWWKEGPPDEFMPRLVDKRRPSEAG